MVSVLVKQTAKALLKAGKVPSRKKKVSKKKALKKDPTIKKARDQAAKNIKQTRALKRDAVRGRKVLKKAKQITGKKKK